MISNNVKSPLLTCESWSSSADDKLSYPSLEKERPVISSFRRNANPATGVHCAFSRCFLEKRNVNIGLNYVFSRFQVSFCSKCGGQNVEADRFCRGCGHDLSPAAAQPTGPNTGWTQTNPFPESYTHSERIADTSRFSHVGIEKFLAPGERVVHVTPGNIRYANQQRHAYVTNKRVMFYGQQGVMLGLIKNDRLDEVFLNQIRKLRLVEHGMITKQVYLELDEMQLQGQRGSLLDLYRAIQSARAAS